MTAPQRTLGLSADGKRVDSLLCYLYLIVKLHNLKMTRVTGRS